MTIRAEFRGGVSVQRENGRAETGWNFFARKSLLVGGKHLFIFIFRSPAGTCFFSAGRVLFPGFLRSRERMVD